MKIGLSTTSIEPGRTGGMFDGFGHYTQHLRDGLRAAGHEVAGYSFPPLFGGRDVLREGSSMPAPFSLMAAGALGGMAGCRPDCDLFHITDFKVVPMRIPVVVTVWDAIPLLHPEWLSKRIRLFAPAIIKRTVPRADRVIVGTDHGAREVAAHFRIPESRISIVPWGIGSHWLEPIPEPTRQAVLDKYGLKPGYFLTVGTIQPRKNIDTLLTAYRLLPPSLRQHHKLVIVGRYGWGKPELLARLEDAVARGDVVWLRSVTRDEDVRALYAAAHVYVFPSLYEGFGIPLLEAFASEVPVIASNRTALPEVGAGAALEVDPLDVAEMAEAMSMLAQDAKMRAEHIGRGRRRARELNIDAAVEATIAVYEKTLATGKVVKAGCC